jgi:hypothetical protein
MPKHKIKINSAKYKKASESLIAQWFDIQPCVHCGYPHLVGYCCNNCGSTYPSGWPTHLTKEDKEADLEEWK